MPIIYFAGKVMMLEFLQANFLYFFLGGVAFAALALIAFFLNVMRMGNRMDKVASNLRANPKGNFFGQFFGTMFGGFIFVPLLMLAGGFCELLAAIGFIIYIIDKVKQ